MVAKAKENLGKMPCPCCGEPVALKKADTGTLSFKCEDADCEQTGFAQAHTGAARKWLAKVVRRAAAPEPDSAPKPAPARQAPASAAKPPDPAPIPAPPPKTPPKPAFSLGNL